MRLPAVLITGVLAASAALCADQSPAPARDASTSSLVVQEESASGGQRVRVSTPTVSFRASKTAALGLRVECLHPVGSRPEPKNCLVYVVHTAAEPKYSVQHSTAFQVEADQKKVFDGALSNFATNRDGADVVEPLVGFWDFSLLKTLSAAKNLTFVLAGQRIPAGQKSIEALREMVSYFASGPAV